jgi:hypothetical protein
MRFQVGDAVTLAVDGHLATIEEIRATTALVRTDEGLHEEVPLETLRAPRPEEPLDTADGTVLGE